MRAKPSTNVQDQHAEAQEHIRHLLQYLPDASSPQTFTLYSLTLHPDRSGPPCLLQPLAKL
jgi:hypothetical protein